MYQIHGAGPLPHSLCWHAPQLSVEHGVLAWLLEWLLCLLLWHVVSSYCHILVRLVVGFFSSCSIAGACLGWGWHVQGSSVEVLPDNKMPALLLLWALCTAHQGCQGFALLSAKGLTPFQQLLHVQLACLWGVCPLWSACYAHSLHVFIML